MHRMHHPKSGVNRLHLPRKEGARGLNQFVLFLQTAIIEIDSTNGWMLKLVKNHGPK